MKQYFSQNNGVENIDPELKYSSRIIGRFSITYANGITQIMDLISHTDYENIIKPILNRIHDLQITKKDKEVGYLKIQLSKMFGDNWFTDRSPIFGAYKTGLLILPETQGGTTNCKVIRIH